MAVGQELSRESAECACEMVGFQNATFMWRLAGVRQHALSDVLPCPTLSLAYRCTNVMHMTAILQAQTQVTTLPSTQLHMIRVLVGMLCKVVRSGQLQ